ncbi:MAG: hypothetical protein ISR95_00580 [Candidatus Marinimicrobia bacterium]|nr:hypothetical protein [Candidatus Neomarinimicrobiota bacterium]
MNPIGKRGHRRVDDLGFVYKDYTDGYLYYDLLGEDVSTEWYMFSDYGYYLEPYYYVYQVGNTVYAVSGIYAEDGINVGCGEAQKI